MNTNTNIICQCQRYYQLGNHIDCDALVGSHTFMAPPCTIDYRSLLSNDFPSLYNQAIPSLHLDKKLSYWKHFTKKFQVPYRVAIVTPIHTRFFANLITGFLNNLKETEGLNVIPTIYNTDGDVALLSNRILPALLYHHYDLIYTVGRHCTKIIADFFQYRTARSPILFSSAFQYNQLDLDRSYVAGVGTDFTPNIYVDALLAAKPEMKKVALLYNPYEFDGVGKIIKEEILLALTAKNILVLSVPFYNLDQIIMRTEEVVSHVDSIVTTPGMIDHKMVELTAICSQAGTTLCASNPYGIQDGAALAFGYPEHITGKIVAQKAAAILRDKQATYELPIHPTYSEYQILINSRTQYQQGLTADFSRKLFTKNGLII